MQQPVPDAPDEQPAEGGAVRDADRDELRVQAPRDAVQALGRGGSGDRLLADLLVSEPLQHVKRVGAQDRRDVRVRRGRGALGEDGRHRRVDGDRQDLVARGRGDRLREAQRRGGGGAAVVADDDGSVRVPGVRHRAVSAAARCSRRASWWSMLWASTSPSPQNACWASLPARR